jgi:polar amino acid transport system substrate-binding protein
MKFPAILGSVIAAIMSVSAATAGLESAEKELAPTGKLRVGVAFAPAATAFFVTKDANGAPHGVTADLGAALAKKLGVPVEYTVMRNSGELTDALSSGAIDVTFMPADEERKQRVAFGPAYFLIGGTFLVSPSSTIKTIAEVDRAGVTVAGIANTTVIRAASRSLKQTKVNPVPTVAEALEMLRSGKVDALAFPRDALDVIAPTLPGSRILDGNYSKTGIAVAVQKNHPAALAFVSEFMEDAKASGLVRKALDDAGLKAGAVAPPEPHAD